MENAHRNPFKKAELGNKAAGQNDSARRLKRKGPVQHAPRQPDDACVVRQVQARAHHHALAQRNGAVRQKRRDGGQRHKSQAADLDQQQDDRLTKAGPMRRCADPYQAGHASGGGGREQCVQKRRGLPAASRDRQGEQHGPRQDNGKKAQRHDRCRSHAAHTAVMQMQAVHSRIPFRYQYTESLNGSVQALQSVFLLHADGLHRGELHTVYFIIVHHV